MKNLLLILTLTVVQAYGQKLYPVSGSADCSIPQPVRSSARVAATNAGIIPRVRVGYVVPSNRAPQYNYKENLQFAVEMVQQWFRDHMQQNGFGPKTFIYETEENSTRPKINLIQASVDDVYMRGNSDLDLFDRSVAAAENAGYDIFKEGEVWILVPETHIQGSDSFIGGGLARGGGGGNGLDGGVAQLTSLVIHLFNPQTILNNSGYAGNVVPVWGPYTLIQDVSFKWFEGTTFSSVASSYLGALAHELGHAFGLSHDLRNDHNTFGGLMGSGMRGIRGSFFPSIYGTEYARLEYNSALQLNQSHYFNTDKTDNYIPSINILTSGPVNIENGLLGIRFSASDADGLAYALLYNSYGEVIDEMPLNTAEVDATFRTPYYTPGSSNNFTVVVGDAQGNRAYAPIYNLYINETDNRAPQPFLRVLSPNAPYQNNDVLFDAIYSQEPNGEAFYVEYDFDNDGTFDTSPMGYQVFHTMTSTGPYQSRIRVTDARGASAVSEPISGNYGKNCAIDPPFITGPAKTCKGVNVQLTANHCYGIYSWSTGATTQTITVGPNETTSYTVNCQYGCANQTSQGFTVTVADDIQQFSGVAGNGVTRAGVHLQSTQSVATGSSQTFVAGRSITLLPGFVADKGSVFSTRFQACGLPQGNPDNFTVNIDAPTKLNVLANDFDIDGTLIKDLSHVKPPVFVIQPVKGSTTFNPDGTITYTSFENATGTDSFTYAVCNSTSPGLCGWASVTINLQQTTNPVQNPGFETYTDFVTSPWKKGGWKVDWGVFTWESTAGRNGTACIRLYSGPLIGNTETNDIHAYQHLTLSPNKSYILKGWVKTVDVTHISNPNGKGATIGLLMADNPWPPVSIGLQGNTDWTRLSLPFTTGPTGLVTIACRLGYTNQDSEGTAYFDDLKVIPVD